MVVSQPIAVSKIEENSWNPNKMAPERWEALLGDMRKGGPSAIDPILVMSKRVIVPDAPKDSFIAVDGNHRLRGSRKLRWPKIYAFLDATITSEKQARMISYAKNYERGSMDPYKQAEYFKWFVDQGWTKEDIAKKHRIDRTTVTRILSLLKIAPEVKTKLADVPCITISHLEPIATAPHHIQREVVKHINKRDHSTVADVARCTRHITEEFEKREKLRKATDAAKFPKCPTCGKSPNDFDVTYDGRKNEDNVRCENWHRWSLSKGLERERPKSGEPSEPTIPQSIKSERAMSDFRAAFNTAISELLPTISNITDIDINSSGKIEDIHIAGQAGGKIRQVVTAMLPSIGKIEHIHVKGKTKSGKNISLSVTLYDWSLEFGLERQGGKNYNLKISNAKIKDHPELRTRVGLTGYGNRIVSKEDLSKLELQVRDLFQEYGDDSC